MGLGGGTISGSCAGRTKSVTGSYRIVLRKLNTAPRKIELQTTLLRFSTDSYILYLIMNLQKLCQGRQKLHITVKETDLGHIKWFCRGSNSRPGGLPATIWCSGTMEWRTHGVLERYDDLPASVQLDGSRFWFHDGVIHRDNKPAMILANKCGVWYTCGVLTKIVDQYPDENAVDSDDDEY